MQEAFVKLAAQRRPPDRPAAWLYRVVRNAAVSAGRSERRRRRREAMVAGRAPQWFVPSHEASMDAESAAAALRELAPERSAVIVARIWGGLTFEEIAEAARCSSSAAHRRYAAGIRALRERLGVTCNETRTPS